MMGLDLDEIERVTNAATPGPWDTGRSPKQSYVLTDEGYLLAMMGRRPEAESRNDAEFISRAREWVPALVAELRRVLGLYRIDDRVRELEARVIELEAARSDCTCSDDGTAWCAVHD